MQNDMTKLNTLITKESGLREALEQNTVLMENDFIQVLRVSRPASPTDGRASTELRREAESFTRVPESSATTLKFLDAFPLHIQENS